MIHFNIILPSLRSSRCLLFSKMSSCQNQFLYFITNMLTILSNLYTPQSSSMCNILNTPLGPTPSSIKATFSHVIQNIHMVHSTHLRFFELPGLFMGPLNCNEWSLSIKRRIRLLTSKGASYATQVRCRR
jgi:hypothetical protein